MRSDEDVRACSPLLASACCCCGVAGPRHGQQQGTRGARGRDGRAARGASRRAPTSRWSSCSSRSRRSRQELRTLRGQIEEARHELEALQQQQRDLYGDLDRRLLLIENGAGGAAASAGAGGAAPDGAGRRCLAPTKPPVYGDAFAALKAGRYEEAVAGFQLYLAKYPRGPRADNATYWLGEAQYVQQDYDAALKSFQAVQRRSRSRARLPDAMLKVGYCQYELKAFRNARATLQKVVATYPGHRCGAARAGAARQDGRRGPVSRLKITETFVSIQGEADAVGWPTLFIRLTGCPLRCVYCDTQYVVLRRRMAHARGAARGRARQRRAPRLRHRRRAAGAEGLPRAAARRCATRASRCRSRPAARMDVAPVDPRVSRVVDLKTPGSGEAHAQPAREPRRARRRATR